MSVEANLFWEPSLRDPSRMRRNKPRDKGITIVIDNGLGLRAFSDLVETASAYIDFIKLGFGTSALYPLSVLKGKIGLARKHDIRIFPGGTFFEMAVVKGELFSYFKTVKALGFQAVEISDGTIEMSRSFRDDCIRQAVENELTVLTECGKKLSGSRIHLNTLQETLLRDIEFGASLMMVEGRESGENVGIFNSAGDVACPFMETIRDSLGDLCARLVWEAPKKKQQVYFLEMLGPDVNLGNISPHDVYSLESLRRGLRADTFSFGI
ncbi:phosphosulfolactate synthase [Bacillaceae bacterium]